MTICNEKNQLLILSSYDMTLIKAKQGKKWACVLVRVRDVGGKYI